MAVRGNIFPDGTPCNSVLLGGGSYNLGVHLKLPFVTWLSINGAPIDYELAQNQVTWAARLVDPVISGVPIPAENGDTVELFSAGHTGPVVAFIKISGDGGETFSPGPTLTIAPGETSSGAEMITMVPFFEAAFVAYSIPDQPPATV